MSPRMSFEVLDEFEAELIVFAGSEKIFQESHGEVHVRVVFLDERKDDLKYVLFVVVFS